METEFIAMVDDLCLESGSPSPLFCWTFQRTLIASIMFSDQFTEIGRLSPFNIYIKLLEEVIQQFVVRYHQYTDDA